MEWQTISAIIGVIAGLGAVVGWFFRKGLPAIRKFWRVIDRMVGVPAEGGHPAQPGLFERMDHQDAALKGQDEKLAEQSAVLETIRHEVEFNNGSSVKDAITRIEKKVDDHLIPQGPHTTINVNPGGTP
jgi:hypothetical protein